MKRGSVQIAVVRAGGEEVRNGGIKRGCLEGVGREARGAEEGGPA